MNDKPLRILIIEHLTSGLLRAGITVPVIAGNQPTTQGRENDGVYFFQIMDGAAGWQGRSYSVAEPLLNMKDTQVLETTFQMQALITEDPESTASLGAIDVLNAARMVIASMPFIESMKLNDIGVQRPTNIRTPFFTNDRDQFEMSPSFDFTVSHKRHIIQPVNSVDSIEYDIKRI